MRTWIKICGITTTEDAHAAASAGADAIGLIFTESPRRLQADEARAIVDGLPRHFEKIGVFANEPAETVVETARAAALTGIQLLGDEPPEYLAEVRRLLTSVKILKALTAGELLNGAKPFPDTADALVIDSGTPTKRGGTGLAFDWKQALPAIKQLQRHHRVVIAGGLDPENVRDAVCMFRPAGVDVSSGVEIRPGRKDHDKVRRFISTVRDVDSGRSGCCPPIA